MHQKDEDEEDDDEDDIEKQELRRWESLRKPIFDVSVSETMLQDYELDLNTHLFYHVTRPLGPYAERPPTPPEPEEEEPQPKANAKGKAKGKKK